MSCCGVKELIPGLSLVLSASRAGAERRRRTVDPMTARRRFGTRSIGSPRYAPRRGSSLLSNYTLAQQKEKPGRFPARTFLRRSNGKLAREARCGFGRRLYGRFDRTAATGLRSALWCRNFGAAHRHREVFAFANEIQAVFRAAPVDADQIATVNLLGGEQIGHRENHVALNRALQVARSIALVGAFLKQELAARLRDTEKELALRCFENTLLNHGQLDVEDLLELCPVQRMEDHNLIEAVHELRRELPAS